MAHDIKKIYKYMSFKRAVSLFESQHIRMTQPTSLNDIFENPIEDNVWAQFANEIGDVSITSYTETPTNLLMWSHYADEYKGVVIAFDAHNTFFENLKRVRYNEHQGTGKNQPENKILQKGNDWIYEKEWRQVWESTSEDKNNRPTIDGEIDHLPNNGGYDQKADNQDDYSNNIYLRKIPMESINEIIYGPRYDKNNNFDSPRLNNHVNDTSDFQDYLMNHFTKITQRQAYPSKNRFEIKLRNITNNG